MTLGADDAAADHQHQGAGPEACRAVVRAALSVAQQRGYHGTTVTRVAEAAGVDPSVVTDCFPDRVALLRAALADAASHWYDEAPTWKDDQPLPDLGAELDRRLGRGVATQRRAADFWRLGLLLRLEPALAGSDCGDLFLEVRGRTRDALRDYWAGILQAAAGSGSSDEPGVEQRGLVDLAVRGHLSLVDGGVLASNATPEWDLERMMAFLARGIATALAEAHGVIDGAPSAESSPR